MNAAKLCTALLLLGSTAAPSLAVEAFVPYRVQREDGVYVDWFDGSAGSMGRYLSDHNLKMKAFYLQAKSLAEENGRPPLLGFLRQVSIDGEKHLGDDAETFDKVKALVGHLPAARTDVNGTMLRAILKVPLYGADGILGVLLPPPPAPASPGAAQASAADAPAAGGAHTGLVIDASGLQGGPQGPEPSLLPRVVDPSGRVVYGLEHADPATAREVGLAAFVSRVEVKTPEAGPAPRQGTDPLRLKAVGVTGPGHTQFVVSAADADTLMKDASSAWLRSCRVVIVMPPAGPPLQPNGLPRVAAPGKVVKQPVKPEKPR